MQRQRDKRKRETTETVSVKKKDRVAKMLNRTHNTIKGRGEVEDGMKN